MVDGWENFDGDSPIELHDTDYGREKCMCKLQAQFRTIALVLNDVRSIRQFQ